MPLPVREPFRLLFPVGAVLGWLGVLPWLLYALGARGGWPGLYHSLAMTQGFGTAIALGFLGTMIPRRTGTAPASRATLAGAAVAVTALPALVYAGALLAGQILYLGILAGLFAFVLRRLGRASPGARRPPASFVFIPAGLVGAAAGGVLLATHAVTGSGLPLAVGRGLAGEGLLLGLVLALAPLLTPPIAHGGVISDEPAPPRVRIAFALAALAFLASFVVEHLASARGGLLLRGLVAAAVLGAAGALRVPTVPGLHRRMYWLALLLVPVGLLAAAALPALRLPLRHVTYVGGISLLIFAVSLHVSFLHTGREALAAARPRPALAIAGLTLAAAAARAAAEAAPALYLVALGGAAALWLGAALVWGLYLAALIGRPGEARAG